MPASFSSRRIKTCLVLLAACLGVVLAQEGSSIDADGNTVVYSVGLDEQGLPTTAFLETIPAAGAGGAPAATITDIGDASAVPPAALPDPTSNPVVTRDDVLSSPTGTVTSRPVTYVVYLTVDGVQVTSIATFTPKTPTPSTTIPPQSGTIVDIATYLPPPPPSSTTTSSASARYWPSKHTCLASFGIVTSMLLGAFAVW